MNSSEAPSNKGVQAAPCLWLSCGAAGQSAADLRQLQIPCIFQESRSAVVPVGVWQAADGRAGTVFLVWKAVS